MKIGNDLPYSGLILTNEICGEIVTTILFLGAAGLKLLSANPFVDELTFTTKEKLNNLLPCPTEKPSKTLCYPCNSLVCYAGK